MAKKVTNKGVSKKATPKKSVQANKPSKKNSKKVFKSKTKKSVSITKKLSSKKSSKKLKQLKPVTNLSNLISTQQIPIPEKIVDQVIGQDHAVKVIKKAALQRRHVLLIGEPGTGKSLLGVALAELIPKGKLVDILSFKNPNDENQPLIRTVPAKQGRALIAKSKSDSAKALKGQNIIFIILAIVAMISPWWIRSYYLGIDGAIVSSIMFAATFLGGLVFLVALVLMINMSKKSSMKTVSSPKLIVDNFDNKTAPFFDATGSHAGALLGDVLHDPFQSGGLGTPAHERVISGMIHKAHMGVLFIDEIATLNPNTQQELLTAIQEGRFSITGQSERSAGAMVRTEPVPCKFILISAGNLDGLKGLHPALRSRIRGYGYEIYMKNIMKDSVKNRFKLAQFIAQEVKKDGKIPHFSKPAVNYIIDEARRRASRKGHLTLRLRELGGLIRSAGDLAREQNANLVEVKHLLDAKVIARGLEQQLADRYIENKKDYEILVTKGVRVGRVNGLAVLGDGSSLSGIVLPIESEVVPCVREPKVIATGKLGEIAKEAITNVSAIVRKYFGDDVKTNYDIYVQFLQTYEGVEGDSASLAVATAMISALKNIPIKQNIAITGSVSVRGETLPVGGVSAKVEAAIDTGISTVIVPRSNLQDIVIDKNRLEKIKIIPVDNVIQVLEHILDWSKNKSTLAKIKKLVKK